MKPKEYSLEKYKPVIQVPDFWPVTWKQMEEQFANVKKGMVTTIGNSYSGRPIRAVSYKNNNARLKVAIISGEHGHETTGPASIFNLIAFLEGGKTLHGKPLNNIYRDFEYHFIPVVNVDGRCRNLPTCVGITSSLCSLWAYGLYKNRVSVPSMKTVKTDELFLLGGKYNDQGVDITADGDKENLLSSEMKAVLAFMKENKADILIDIHCAQHTSFLTGCYETIPLKHRNKLMKLKQTVTGIGRENGYVVGDPGLDRPIGNSSGQRSYELLMLETGCWSMLFETPAGLIDTQPLYTHEELIDLGLFFIKQIIVTAEEMNLRNEAFDI